MVRRAVFLLCIVAALSAATPSIAAFDAAKQHVMSQKISAAIDRAKGGRVGYVFIDARTGLGVQVNGTMEFPAASVAKVPVLCAIFHAAYSDPDLLQKKLRYKESDRVGGSGVLQWMRADTDYTVWNLARLMIVLSDNVATRILVENFGMKNINQYLEENGLKATRVTDPTMLVEPPSSEVNLTSPYEMAKLISMIARGDGFSPADQKDMLSFMRHQRYHWGIWRGVPAGVVVADKTGNLGGILNDAGIVYSKSGNYILSIFTWGFKKQREARLLINDLSKTTYETYTGEKVIKPVKKTWHRPVRKLKRTKAIRIKSKKHRTRKFIKRR
ncbi:MAG TPA: serine hydrolase [Candidatus Omnitrophota bacterium]|nr:serine hydrolase [Candidatus Omnitrophota bacterium]